MNNSLLSRAAVTLVGCLLIASVCSAQPFTAPAKLNALSKVQLSSELAARVTEVRLRAGDRFSKGDLLASFDCTELQAELEGAESKRDLARRQRNANISLKKLGGNISELELVQSEAQLAEAVANAKVLKHRHSFCEVRAPFSGFVITRNAEPHQRAEVGMPLFELVDNRALEVEAIVPSDWLDQLTLNSTFLVTITETDRTYTASVQRIVPLVDPVTRTVRVIGTIESDAENPGINALLISGMSGEAQFYFAPDGGNSLGKVAAQQVGAN
uniref:efflux RND transporter periplasmic adaptor subunit n=1 Tax=Microbulbifer agarilyticus TaxID=260552 RepID=UPI000255B5AF|nr:efflux RND transporter periplasmic adaptor subunit [Microbulbifer agarilyticus]